MVKLIARQFFSISIKIYSKRGDYKYEDKTYYLRGYTGEGADHRMLFIKLTEDNTLTLKIP